MRIDTKLNISEYMDVVSEIVDGHFDDDGNYVPHIGKIAAMEAFFNHCVKEHRFELQEQSEENPYPIDIVFTDDDFVTAFNDAVDDTYKSSMNFGNAYRDALKIVEDKRSSIGRVVTMISAFVEQYFTPDNLAKLFGDSNRFQEIASGENVVSFVEQALNKQ